MPGPLNGEPFDSNTNNLGDSPRPGSVSEDPRDEKLNKQGARIKQALDAFIFDIFADPTVFTIHAQQDVGSTEITTPLTGLPTKIEYPTFKDFAVERKNVIQNALTQPKMWEEILADYKKRFLQGEISLSKDDQGKPGVGKSGLAQGLSAIQDHGQFKEIFEDDAIKALKRTPQGKKLLDELGNAIDMFGEDIHSAWVNDDYSRLMVVVGTVLCGGAVMVGAVNAIQQAKDDKAAKVLAAGASLISKEWKPDNLYHVGKIKIGMNDVTWVPSQGKWNVSSFTEVEWKQTGDFKFKAKLDLFATHANFASNPKTGAKVTGSVSYKLGWAHIDSVDTDVTVLPSGQYEVGVKAVKEVAPMGEKFNIYIGLEHKGAFGEHDFSKGTGAVAGFAFTTGEP